MNLVDADASTAQAALLDISHQLPEITIRDLCLAMPTHHDVRAQDVDLKRLGVVLAVAYERDLHDFAALLLLEKLGPRTLQSLALIAEVVHGAPVRFSDPARFSFAHGGKDGHPFPVPLKTYDASIAVLRSALDSAKTGDRDKVDGMRRLEHSFARWKSATGRRPISTRRSVMNMLSRPVSAAGRCSMTVARLNNRDSSICSNETSRAASSPTAGSQTPFMELLQELLTEELKDLLHAEGQLVKALPKMAKAAKDADLRTAFEDHLEQTKDHVERLKQVFEMLDEKPKAKPCKGMAGLVEEGAEVITDGKQMEEAPADLALIGAAQRVEHYEIAAYGTARAIAEQMNRRDIVKLLSQTLAEEEKADQLLTKLAQPLLQEAGQGTEEEELEEEEA